jgi:Icc-related predicted phosphoesterase
MSQLRFLAFSDLEGRYDLVAELLRRDLSQYDFLLYKGDTPDPSMYKKIRKEQTLSGVAWEKRCTSAILDDFPETKAAFLKAIDDSRKVNDVFALLKEKLPILGVLGNSDTAPTVVAPMLGLEPVDFAKNMTIIHNRVVEYNGYSIVGYNGRAQYCDETVVDAPQLYFAEAKAEEDLSALFAELDPEKTILVTHAPPYGVLDKVNDDWIEYGVATYGEKAKEGHIGSDAFAHIVAKYEPLLHTFGHIHEAAGVVKRGDTVFINGGALGESGDVEEAIIEGTQVTAKWLKVGKGMSHE